MIFSFFGRFWWLFSSLGQFWWFFDIWCLEHMFKKDFSFLGISVPIFGPDFRSRLSVPIFGPDFRSCSTLIFQVWADFDDFLYFNFWFLVTVSWGELLFKLLLKFYPWNFCALKYLQHWIWVCTLTSLCTRL